MPKGKISEITSVAYTLLCLEDRKEMELNLNDIDNLTDVAPLEKLKLKLEYEKLLVERRKTWVTAISIVIPLILGAVTILYGIRSENQRAVSNFEIKAVEIVMNAFSPKAATNKAIVLSELFPDRLPKTFRERMLTMYGLPEPSPRKK